jgi:hypothetical protein
MPVRIAHESQAKRQAWRTDWAATPPTAPSLREPNRAEDSMSQTSDSPHAKVDSSPDDARNLYLVLTSALQFLLVGGLILFLVHRNWENVFLTAVVIGLTLIPALLFRRHRVIIPPEFQLISALFIFLSLFLGSALDFYYHFWWWDLMLHTASGFLLGMIGFITLYLLNQTDRLPPELTPAFRCFFGFTFAVTLGVLWEIFEFTMDQLWPGLDMQSTGIGTGVVDTMKDLIVDTIGALVVALMGYAYLKTGRYSFIGDGVRAFLRKNPRLVGRQK